jgi:hypothetical protein
MTMQQHSRDRLGHIDRAAPTLTRDTDRCAADLDDFSDREELRQRYKRLLEETRVLLPGVQLFAAFLFTVPFTTRFGELDDRGRVAYGAAIGSAVLAVVLLASPIAFHRVAERTARSARLVWGIRATVAALAFISIALISATLCVASFVFGPAVGALLATVLTATILVLWVLLPISYRHMHSSQDGRRHRSRVGAHERAAGDRWSRPVVPMTVRDHRTG